MTANAHSRLRATLRMRRHLPDVQRVERLAKALEDFDRGGNSMVSYTSGLANSEVVRAAGASEPAVAAALGS
jgi:hypothetical protein